jgi:hypothetical protein
MCRERNRATAKMIEPRMQAMRWRVGSNGILAVSMPCGASQRDRMTPNPQLLEKQPVRQG